MPQLPSRPASARPSAVGALVGRARDWCRWVGPARALGGATVVLAVVAGGYWLVRPPELPTEAELPFTSTTTTTTAATAASAPSADDAGVPTTDASRIVVHVAGAVRSPGVYELTSAARAVDAVEAAGGLAADADGDAINLAARLADGQRVYVPRVGEEPPIDPAAGGEPGDTVPSGPLDINAATAQQLETLPGIGPATAAAIIAYRDLHGPFTSVDELAEVSGIGEAKLAAIRGLVTV